MKYKDRITAAELIDQIVSKILLVQYGTKRIEYDFAVAEFIVLNGDDIIWQGPNKITAIRRYNKEQSRLIDRERELG